MSWSTELLQDVATFTLGKMLDAEKNRGEFRLYLANVNVRWGEFELSDLREMRFQETELDRFGLKYGDIVMCEGGEPGRCAIWKNQLPAMMVQKALHRIRAGDRLDYRFLYYVFLHQGRTGTFSGLFTGATIKHLPKDKLAQIRVPVPPLPTQRRIADILSAYDDLIENNTQRIAILEDMARRLFEEWFVQRRPPVELAGTEDWIEAAIGDAFTLQRGFDLPASERTDGPYPVVAASGIHGFHRQYKVKGPGVTTGRSGTIGQFQYIERNFWPLNTSLWIKEFKHGGPIFAYYLLSSLNLTGNNTGSAVPSLNRNIVHAMPTILPPLPLVSAFEAVAGEMRSYLSALVNANTNLRTTRDLLLPKLISGEIEVRAAEEALETAAA